MPAGTAFATQPAHEGDGLERRITAGALIFAAGLIGFGLILWIAANWDDLGKAGRFALAGTALAVSCGAAAAFPRARVAALLAAVLASGGLLALFGQTYQTGADAWQLFAGWAALTLPFALAARHDAVWSLWTVVVFTALPLWARAETGWGMWTRLDVMLPVWLLAAGLTAAFSPWLGLERWLGRTPWSFRLACILTIILVATTVASGIGSSRPAGPIVWLGFAVLAGAALVLLVRPPFDLPLLSATVLAIDILLILAVGRMVMSVRGPDFGEWLVTALASAAIVGASAMALLREARRRGVLTAADMARGGAADGSGRTWPIAVVSGIGAVIAAFPFIGFGFALLGPLIERGIGTYIVALPVLAGAMVVLRRSDPLGFRQQLAVIGVAIGAGLLAYALFRDLPLAAAAIVMAAVSAGLAALVPAGWMAGLLGAFATVFLATAVTRVLSHTGGGEEELARLVLVLLAAAASAGLVALRPGSPLALAAGQPWLTPFVTGAMASLILGMMVTAGPTFLLGHAITGGAAQGYAFAAVPAIERALSVASAAGSVWLVMTRIPEARTAVALALAAVGTVLAAVAASPGPLMLATAAALVTQRRALALLGAFGLLWVLGSFYYWLGWPLVHKAYLLAGLGLALAVLAVALGRVQHRDAAARAAPAAPGGLLAPILVGLGAIAVAGTVGTSIRDVERLIAGGERVYVALAPVDPRSLMQGDYMALRFATTPALERAKPGDGSRMPYVVLKRDAQGIGRVERVVDKPGAREPDEIIVALHKRGGRWSLGPDAWFFKEGTAKTFEAARFGEFRVTADGRSLLVGMADDKLQPLR